MILAVRRRWQLLDQLDDHSIREWYAGAAIEHGWSRAVLTNQIMS